MFSLFLADHLEFYYLGKFVCTSKGQGCLTWGVTCLSLTCWGEKQSCLAYVVKFIHDVLMNYHIDVAFHVMGVLLNFLICYFSWVSISSNGVNC